MARRVWATTTEPPLPPLQEDVPQDEDIYVELEGQAILVTATAAVRFRTGDGSIPAVQSTDPLCGTQQFSGVDYVSLRSFGGSGSASIELVG